MVEFSIYLTYTGVTANYRTVRRPISQVRSIE